MLLLPIQGNSGRSAELPLGDLTALRLAECLLDPTGSSKRLAQTLRADPPLVLWLALKADEFRTLGELADCLQESEPLATRLASCCAKARHFSNADQQSISELFRASMEASQLASSLTAGEAHRNEAELLGLLHNAPQWLAATCGQESENGKLHKLEPPHSEIPSWLSARLSAISGTDANDPSAASVSRALELRKGDGKWPRVEVGFSRRKFELLSRQALQAWSQNTPEARTLLPKLANNVLRLRQLQTQFDERLETEKLEAMAAFAGGAGHEINNPLTVISGRAQMLLHDEQDPQRRRELAHISSNAKRAYEMVADMMHFSRPSEPEPSQVDLGELVDDVLDELRQSALQRQIELQREERRREAVLVRADQVQIRIALRAVCDNALHALEPGGRLRLEVQPAEPDFPAGKNRRTAQIVISDNGPGIPPAVRRHLFDPFYSGRSSGRGLGIGLAKAWRIAHLHGGTIQVESTEGEGALFRIILPLEGPEGRQTPWEYEPLP